MIRVQRANTICEALALKPREHIALVGGGGKTTLLFKLSAELKGPGRKVLTSTTTKVWQREAEKADSVWFTFSRKSWKEDLRKDIGEGKISFLALQRLESGKVQGVDPSLLDAIYEKDLDYLVVEADGAAGHPVKAPSGEEPQVPTSATIVLAIAGLEALGNHFGPDVVFRESAFEKITRIAPGETITPLALSRLFVHPEGLFRFTPSSARKVAFLNKTDLPHDREQALELSRLILGDQKVQVERVVVGSLWKGEWEVHKNQSAEVGDQRSA